MLKAVTVRSFGLADGFGTLYPSPFDLLVALRPGPGLRRSEASLGIVDSLLELRDLLDNLGALLDGLRALLDGLLGLLVGRGLVLPCDESTITPPVCVSCLVA